MSRFRSHVVREATFLVTGGAGFIGSHLSRRLLDDGARSVIAMDNLRTGSWNNTPTDQRLRRVTADLSLAKTEELSALLDGVDYVFHLAAEKHNQALDIPERILEVNVGATFRLFAAASAAQVKKVVFTSSLYAAGRLHLPAMREDDLPDPRTVYGISKLTGEHLLRHFASAAELHFAALRLFFVFGPRQFAGSGYKSVIVKNFERILRGEAPVIKGDGEQSLDYVYVDDVVEALILSLCPEADGGLFNIASGQAVTVSHLTDEMLTVAGSSLHPAHAAPDWTAGTHRVGDNTRAREVLGWSPTVPLREGLHAVYNWMRAR